MKLKNAEFKTYSEAVKFHEKGGKIYCTGARLKDLVEVCEVDLSNHQIQDNQGWEQECIKHEYPCWYNGFGGDPEKDEMLGILVKDLRDEGEPGWYKVRRPAYQGSIRKEDEVVIVSFCRPVRTEECYQGEES